MVGSRFSTIMSKLKTRRRRQQQHTVQHVARPAPLGKPRARRANTLAGPPAPPPQPPPPTDQPRPLPHLTAHPAPAHPTPTPSLPSPSTPAPIRWRGSGWTYRAGSNSDGVGSHRSTPVVRCVQSLPEWAHGARFEEKMGLYRCPCLWRYLRIHTCASSDS